MMNFKKSILPLIFCLSPLMASGAILELNCSVYKNKDRIASFKVDNIHLELNDANEYEYKKPSRKEFPPTINGISIKKYGITFENNLQLRQHAENSEDMTNVIRMNIPASAVTISNDALYNRALKDGTISTDFDFSNPYQPKAVITNLGLTSYTVAKDSYRMYCAGNL